MVKQVGTRSMLMAGWTADELLCFDRAMEQWEASLKRPDLRERDRVAGALEAYVRQAFCTAANPTSILPSNLDAATPDRG